MPLALRDLQAAFAAHIMGADSTDLIDVLSSFDDVITEKYLEYLEVMQSMSVELAAEYLVMAATLIHIKSKMLLPRDPLAPADAQDDPRSELVNRLLLRWPA